MPRTYELLLVAGIAFALAGLMGMAAVNTDGGGSETWEIGCAGLVVGIALIAASVAAYFRANRRQK